MMKIILAILVIVLLAIVVVDELQDRKVAKEEAEMTNSYDHLKVAITTVKDKVVPNGDETNESED